MLIDSMVVAAVAAICGIVAVICILASLAVCDERRMNAVTLEGALALEKMSDRLFYVGAVFTVLLMVTSVFAIFIASQRIYGV